MAEAYRVVDVAPIYQLVYNEEGDYPPVAARYPIGLRLYLENGEMFEMYYVPPEVIEALEMIRNGNPPPRRQSLFSLLAFHDEFKDLMDKSLDKVVIDEFDENTGVYTATVHFESDGLHLTVKMIPSHALFLAMITDKPVYVSEELLEVALEEEEDNEGEESEDFY